MATKEITKREVNRIAKKTISSIEEFMEKCPVSIAKSAVKFWLCTGPNPILNKARTKYTSPPKKVVDTAEELRGLTHSKELRSAVEKHGMDAEVKIMHTIYPHFYKKGYKNNGCIFGGGFHYDLFHAKAKGKEITNITKTW